VRVPPVAASRDYEATRRKALRPAGGERVAGVIDLGSNSWRFVAYRYTPHGAWRRVAQLQEPVRIASGLAATGVLAAERVAHGLDSLELFARYGRSLYIEAHELSVVATSALRDAANGAEVLAGARSLTGLEIRSLTAAEEAHYGYVAAVNSSTLTDGLALDLGGGSLQVVAVRDRRAVASASWPLGAVRVTETLLPGDRHASRKHLKRARAALREALNGHDVLRSAVHIVGMGGSVRNLASAAMRARQTVQGSMLSIGELRDLIAGLARRAPRDRALAGIKSARADIILGAALVLEAVLQVAGVDAIEVTRAGLREGVFFSERLLPGESPMIADVRATAVRNLIAQHAVDPARAGRVAELAMQLHDSAREAGAIEPARDERELLWMASMLHDIGMAVGYDGHPSHARYLLLNSELYGFAPRDVALVAQIVRYHRKGVPALDEARSLARRGDRELVARCALLLRLATQLLLSAGGSPRLEPDGDTLRLRLGGDNRLARGWSDEGFRPAFGRRLVIAG
jgi:exopolyphosphatase/guanosine-5'-triphosphate,3'-diphosphate pyrophosphatase